MTEKCFKSAKKLYGDFCKNPSLIPSSFRYGDKIYRGFESKYFDKVSCEKGTGRNSVTFTSVYRLKGTELFVTVVCAFYEKYDVCEWTLYFENEGSENTDVISDICGADIIFNGKNVKLYGMKGDIEAQFSKYTDNLEKKLVIENETGRPTHTTCPYFSLSFEEKGYNLAVSWQGCFKASFEKVKCENGEENVYFTDGQRELRTFLKPGEKIRTPMTVIQEYRGKRELGINEWRKWFINCNMPGGWKPTVTASISWLYDCMTHADEQSQIDAIEKYAQADAGLEYWWMDAGWYESPAGEPLSSWTESGNYNIDEKRFPTKLEAIHDYAIEKGLKGTILWFEPEIFRTSFDNLSRIYPQFKPEWTLGEQSCLYNMGNPQAVEFLAGEIIKTLKSSKTDVYRQDYNIDPAPAWKAFDESEDRAGITENKYCMGYLKLWDILLERIPGLLIDNCASGGGRLDVESLRRSVPLHRTDNNTENSAVSQGMSMSLYEWIPYSGGPSNCMLNSPVDRYMIRSMFGQSITLNYNITNEATNMKLLSALMKELKILQQVHFGDYYELTEWSRNDRDFTAWEFFDKDKNAGAVQAFRRNVCDEESKKLFLKGLKKNTTYYFCDFENASVTKLKGKEAIKNGITVKLSSRHSATTIYFGTKPIEFPDYGSREEYQKQYFKDSGVPEGAIQLSDIEWQSWKMFRATSEDEKPCYVPSRDSDEYGNVLTIGKYAFEKGLRTHPNEEEGIAQFIYDIGRFGCSNFRAIVGKENIGGPVGKIQFSIEGDGKILAVSPVLEAGETFELKAKIEGVKILKLIVSDGGDGINCDSAGFGNPVIW